MGHGDKPLQTYAVNPASVFIQHWVLTIIGFVVLGAATTFVGQWAWDVYSRQPPEIVAQQERAELRSLLKSAVLQIEANASEIGRRSLKDVIDQQFQNMDDKIGTWNSRLAEVRQATAENERAINLYLYGRENASFMAPSIGTFAFVPPFQNVPPLTAADLLYRWRYDQWNGDHDAEDDKKARQDSNMARQLQAGINADSNPNRGLEHLPMAAGRNSGGS